MGNLSGGQRVCNGVWRRGQRQDGFDELFDAHRDALFRLGMLICGDRSRSEDAVAESFARVYPRWRNGRVHEPAWYLRRVLVNELTQGFRRRAVERRVQERRTGDHRGGSSFDVELSDRASLGGALATLPEGQRAGLVLRFYEDLSEAETAAVLGIPPGTVKSRASRALARLREALEAEEEDHADA